MLIRDRWYVAALAEEVGAKPLGRTLLGEPVVLWRTSEGDVVALEDRCVHRQAPLSLGEVVGDALQCGYHGLAFDRTGRCIRVPGQTTIPPGAAVVRHPVRERQGFVHVWIGDPARAEAEAPYDFPWAERAGWRALYARFHVAADWRLLIDNLMDLSHLAFAHKSTIGTAGVAESARMRTERDGDKVRVSRWMLDIAQAPTHAAATGYDGRVDRWQTIELTPPGFVWLAVGSAVAGTGAEEGRRDHVLLDRNSLHAVTPETETTTHYFWTTAHEAARIGPDREAILYEQSVRASHEDLAIIEAQQKRLDAGRGTVDVNADAGALEARRVLARLAGEAATPRARLSPRR